MAIIIRLHNMVFYGYHGVLPEEQKLGQRFEVDVDFVTKSPARDDLAAAVNYAAVYQVVTAVVTERRFQLIESLAEAIAREITAKFPIRHVTVRVRKPGAPLGGPVDYVEVETSWEAEK